MNATLGTRTLKETSSIHGGDLQSLSGAVDLDEEPSTLKIDSEIPQARDGHSTIVYENMLIVFGGDRHHMPFNDLFVLDLEDFFFNAE